MATNNTYNVLAARLKKAEVEMQRVFMNYANGATKILNTPNAKFIKSFRLNENPLLKSVLSGDNFTEFRNGINQVIRNTATDGWSIASQRNSQILDKYYSQVSKQINIPVREIKGKIGNTIANRAALEGFLKGHGTEKLSGRVWKTAQQFRDEMTVHLGMGALNGDSAQTLSRRIRRNLQNPDALFRRVKYETKDKAGNVIEKFRLSKRAAGYHPGRGVYRSAYKNAMRTTRTMTNQAYWLADQEGWKKQKFTLGYRVSLSPAHPFPDICDELEGDYPKDFMFSGWHPQCFCTITPILMEPADFKQYIKGNTIIAPQTALPQGFQNWMGRNISNSNLVNAKRPYFIRDNIKVKRDKSGFLFNNALYKVSSKVPLPKPIQDIKPQADIIFDKSGIKGKIQKLEKEIWHNDYETGLGFDKNGNKIWSMRGTQSSVPVTLEKGMEIYEGIFSHNHPGGAGFSIGDIKFMKFYNLKEMRATTNKSIAFKQSGTYVAKPTKKFTDAYRDTIDKYLDGLENRINKQAIKRQDTLLNRGVDWLEVSRDRYAWQWNKIWETAKDEGWIDYYFESH